ncbi:putative disease resistance protein RGA3 isoform X2 [Brachypodium distachyon]|uniref:putative disease resistance protein RGA3 isoform X2 n=1 Tax=Brachypodium distachyon TaxID=15368 RepID=UPI000D0DC31C|nr:putative disease resistance protein RGA3 isoform X2 [Brachypodium distachyon]|eukprot:XP_024315884.1 putative disease resistance protein RGA3 isoform X2 [Brachypodium distachyon]
MLLRYFFFFCALGGGAMSAGVDDVLEREKRRQDFRRPQAHQLRRQHVPKGPRLNEETQGGCSEHISSLVDACSGTADMAVDAALWVVSKALAPARDDLLESWAASSKLGTNVQALKMELLYAQGMLDSAQGRDIGSRPALRELLNKLRQLAYAADDVLDELDYFRIQDAIDRTNHAADADGLVRNAWQTARAAAHKLKFGSRSRDDPASDEEDDAKQGCLPNIRPCDGRGREIGCMPKIGKHFPCHSFPSVCGNDVAPTVVLESSDMTRGRRFLCGVLPPKWKFNRVEMSQKMMEIVQQLKPLCAKVSTILNLELLGSTQKEKTSRSKTTPGIVEPTLYGRDGKKKEIIDLILTYDKYCGDGLTVLPIVGPGGIGKTCLIQHIYKELESSFKVLIWICVSLDFNANRLLEEIKKNIPEVEDEKGSTAERIKQRLKSKRFLLVLDDMWTDNEHEWGKLLAPLRNNEGEKGNVVMVTTRKPRVASMVSSTNSLIELERLSENDIMSFFEVCVFGDREPWKGNYLELREVGKEIVSNLKGFPLAAKTVGRLLRNRLTLDHWTRVAESKEWELETDPDDIMPALKLSYDYLPFHLQQCFSNCALFPEDYEFGKKELFHFWIGLGILHSDEHKRAEDVGQGYLDNLVNHGFFKENKNKDGPCYVIHDLLHELAVKVSSYECLSIRSSNVNTVQIPRTVRHLSIIVDNVDVKDRGTFDNYKIDLARRLGKNLDVQNLRTLMLFGEYHGSFIKAFRDLFRKARAIRTILLSGVSYSVEDILQNFSKLIHLRYLRVISNAKVSLPSVLFRLYHLEVIDLEKCYADFGLTWHMSNLIKLHHFLVSEDQLELHSNITEAGKLKFLEELRRFEVGKESKGFELRQLRELTKLGGSLGVYNLENVQANKEAEEQKILHKKYLHELLLEWSNNAAPQEEDILESLVPHQNLQHLCIKGHGGANCPSWLGRNLSVKNLESLCLCDVSWNTLPPLGDFQTLKKLKLDNIRNLKSWVKNDNCHFFSCLEVVEIKDCPELVELPFSLPSCCQAEKESMRTLFPKLQNLKIVNCPQLSSLPAIPWSPVPCSIEIENAGSVFEKLVYSKDDESKLSLAIVGKDRQQSILWSGLAFHNLPDLEVLTLVNCPPLPLIHLEKLKSLKTLNMHNMGSTLLWFEGESHKMESPFPVESMKISCCGANGKELTHVLSHFPKLTYLDIRECEKITGMVLEHQKVATSPSAKKTELAHRTGHQQQQTTGEEEVTAEREELLLLPPQLQELYIWYCSNLVLSTSLGFGGEFQSLCSLRWLTVGFCPQFFSYSSSASSCSPFPTSLQHLTLWDVGGTEMLLPLSNLTSLTSLRVHSCGDLRGEGLWPLVAQGGLTTLDIEDAPKFFSGAEPSWPDDEESSSSSSRVESMVIPCFAGVFTRPICRLLSSSLTKLICWEDKEVERFTAEQEEALQLLTSLWELKFCDCEKLQVLPASLSKLTNLKKLYIQGCPALRSLPNDGFPSCLETLSICDCPAIKSLPDHGLPSSLQELEIESCPAIKSLPSNLPCSLQEIDIINCPGIKSLPDHGLPSFLQKLEIDTCPAIKSLPSNLPSSLQELVICRCPGIKSLHKEGLPSKLRVLDVRFGDNSEELRRQCDKLKGTIPIVKC